MKTKRIYDDNDDPDDETPKEQTALEKAKDAAMIRQFEANAKVDGVSRGDDSPENKVD